MASQHVTIIGAGIVGTSTAAFLQRAGFRVTVIDRVPPGEGCSFGNAGCIAFSDIIPTIHHNMLLKIPGWLLDPLGPLTIRWSYFPKALPWFLAAARGAMPDRVKANISARTALALRVVSDFETLLGDAGTRDLMVYRDALRVFDNPAQFAAEQADRETRAKNGFPCETYSGDEAREMEPDLSPHIAHAATHGGWYYVTNPERVVKSIAQHVARNGGEFLADEVARIECSDGVARKLVLKSGKELTLDKLVVCAGAFSHLLAKQLGEKVLLETERGYHLVLPDSGVKISRTITYARTPGAATPMEMGLRLAGTDEFAGLEAAPNYARSDNLWKLFKNVFPKMKEPGAGATRWMGHRPGMPDGLPVIGPSRTTRNVWYGFGHGHLGLTWGPSTGRLISELIAGRTPNMDISPFSIGRF